MSFHIHWDSSKTSTLHASQRRLHKEPWYHVRLSVCVCEQHKKRTSMVLVVQLAGSVRTRQTKDVMRGLHSRNVQLGSVNDLACNLLHFRQETCATTQPGTHRLEFKEATEIQGKKFQLVPGSGRSNHGCSISPAKMMFSCHHQKPRGWNFTRTRVEVSRNAFEKELQLGSELLATNSRERRSGGLQWHPPYPLQWNLWGGTT